MGLLNTIIMKKIILSGNERSISELLRIQEFWLRQNKIEFSDDNSDNLIESKNEELETVKSELLSITKTKDQISTELSSVLNENQSIKERIGEIEQLLNSEKGAKTDIETELAKINEAKDGLEKDLNKKKIEVLNLNKKIKSLEGR